MNSERWQQIDELFHAALARDASDRAKFLTGQCPSDVALRDEVESLLSSLEEADDDFYLEGRAGYFVQFNGFPELLYAVPECRVYVHGSTDRSNKGMGRRTQSQIF